MKLWTVLALGLALLTPALAQARDDHRPQGGGQPHGQAHGQPHGGGGAPHIEHRGPVNHDNFNRGPGNRGPVNHDNFNRGAGNRGPVNQGVQNFRGVGPANRQGFNRPGFNGGGNRGGERHFSFRGRTYTSVHVGDFRYPRGWGYRRWTVGAYLPRLFLSAPYFFDYGEIGLPPPPPGTYWVRYGPDALLVDSYSGRIVNVVYGVFY